MSKGYVESVGGEHDDTSLRGSKVSEGTGPYNCIRSPGRHNDPDSKDFVNNNQIEGEITKIMYYLFTHEIGETDSFAENSVTKFELPEMRTGFTDSALQNVKDICVDEGKQSVEEVLAESMGDQKISHRLHKSFPNDMYDLKEDTMSYLSDVIDGTDSHGLKSSPVNGLPVLIFDKAGAEHNSWKSMPLIGYMSKAAPSIRTIGEIRLPSPQDFDSDQCQANYSRSDIMADKKQLAQVTLEERNSEAKIASLASEESIQNNKMKGNCGNTEVESEVITYDFDSGDATMNGNHTTIKCTDNKQIGDVGHNSKTEVTVDGARSSARSSFVRHGSGDSNICTPATLYGSVASSGHISYSGSISLRSDSSTTSARSFAFPMLQSEWNSSPVKMAKADRRHVRRHQGWRMGLLCCKF